MRARLDVDWHEGLLTVLASRHCNEMPEATSVERERAVQLTARELGSPVLAACTGHPGCSTSWLGDSGQEHVPGTSHQLHVQ